MPEGGEILSTEAQKLGDRIAKAMKKADQNFWAEIAKAFPEAQSGDFGPEETWRWEQAQEEAVLTWLGWNYPPSKAMDEILGYSREE